MILWFTLPFISSFKIFFLEIPLTSKKKTHIGGRDTGEGEPTQQLAVAWDSRINTEVGRTCSVLPLSRSHEDIA